MRIVALSDQHGHLPAIPPSDLLIVAGDICPDRFGPLLAMHAPEQQKAWFDRNVRPWLADAPAVHKIITWGNHDWCGQACSVRRDAPSEAPSTAFQILVDEGVTLHTNEGPISVWATPWSRQFMNWAFMKSSTELAKVYGEIPEGVDILVSHDAPYGHGDRYFNVSSGRIEHLGSPELLAAIDRVRPRLVICGHIHDGHGRTEYDGIPIYNVTLVDEQYRLVHAPTVIDFP